MTGKEYLMEYMLTHTSEEIYDKIKEIEKRTYGYTDSRLAFIHFLNNECIQDFMPHPMTFTQRIDGSWIAFE